jgi:hypothetical protein
MCYESLYVDHSLNNQHNHQTYTQTKKSLPKVIGKGLLNEH